MKRMTIFRLIRKEILHRKLNFALAVLAVACATGIVVAQFTVLRAHDLCTEEHLQRAQVRAERRLAGMENEYRKSMKKLGFNLLILPKDQDLTEFWQQGHATTTMPEDTVARLANSNTMLVRHLLPLVQQQVVWPEKLKLITLIGTRGEVPLAHRKPKEPMLLAVPEGECVVGAELARQLAIEPNQTLTLFGEEFRVQKVRARRGKADDAAIWVDLKAGQSLLGMEGRIHAIEALKCHCKGVTHEQLIAQVEGLLDNEVQVILRKNEVTARAEARNLAAEEHAEAIEAQRANRAELKGKREAMAGILVPAVLVIAAVWVGLLALGNVRDRQAEIGVLRAIGVRSRSVVGVFLARALFIGVLGAALGYAAGLGAGVLIERMTPSLRVASTAALMEPNLLLAALIAAPLLAMLSSWAPAVLAGRQDPAVILARE